MILALTAVIGLTCALIGLWWNMCDRRSATAAKLMLIGLVCLVASGAWAHDHDRPELDSWFDGLRSGNGPCCSMTDGQTVADPDWVSDKGHYRVKIDDEWIDVADDAVITQPNLFGRTMVWPMKYLDGSVHIRCFMPGSMT